MRWLRSGLFRKFMSVMGAVALIPVVFLGFQLTNISRGGIQDAVLELHTKLAEKLAEEVDDYFKVSNEKITFALASLQTKLDWPEKQQLLRSLIETHADIVEIAMVNAQGQELLKVFNPDLSTEQALTSHHGESGFERFIENGKRSLDVSRSGEIPSLIIYYPMNKMVLARVVVSLRSLEARIGSERVGGTGFAVLIDSEGKPLLFQKQSLTAIQISTFPQWAIVRSALGSNSVGSSEFLGPTKRPWLGAYAPTKAIGNAVIILQSRDEAYQAANRMKRTAIGMVVGAVVVAILGAILFARRLTEPLFALTRAAEAVSRGEFITSVQIDTRDELQDLAETFNRMTAQLRSYSVLQIDRLIAEQRKTAAIMYSINDGILMTDKEGRLQLINRKCLEMFGAAADLAFEGRMIAEVFPESPLRDAVVRADQAPKPDAFKDVDLSTEQTHKYVRVSGYQVVSPGRGSHLGVVVALRDVTLERELDKMKEEFLHYVTHDLRNPLGSAMGFLDVLMKGTAGVLNPDQHNIVSSVKRSTSRLMSMVNNILDIAKMESDRIRLGLKNVSVAGIAGRSISILESLAAGRKVSMKLAATEEFTIDVDPDLIERVFTNLIGNAIKYTPEGGTITVSIQDEEGGLRCCVEDTGEGIPPEYLERIFQKFEQVTGQRKGGTGLGLTIARFFVEAHLGRIWVESQIGKGSRFIFTLPKNLCLDKEGKVMLPEGVA
ncbi:MAG: HAMP domain-containing protein [Elusimicrobia bacterium]|nr:HAMP domain-containing protein [Elusimicrobiota bacterium]